MFCTKCGSQISENGALFCHKCGAKVTAAAGVESDFSVGSGADNPTFEIADDRKADSVTAHSVYSNDEGLTDDDEFKTKYAWRGKIRYIAATVVLAILAITNPSEEKHENAVMARVTNNLKKTGSYKNMNYKVSKPFRTAKYEAEKLIGENPVEFFGLPPKTDAVDFAYNAMFNNGKKTFVRYSWGVHTQSLLFLSFTKGEKMKIIGIGILGSVFLFDNWGLEDVCRWTWYTE